MTRDTVRSLATFLRFVSGVAVALSLFQAVMLTVQLGLLVGLDRLLVTALLGGFAYMLLGCVDLFCDIHEQIMKSSRIRREADADEEIDT